MKIKVVYDNEAKEPFRSDWGYAAEIEIGEETILFDTGEKGEILKHNMEQMGLDTSDIDKIVLSHEHHDHIGGLFSILEESMEVFLPRSFSRKFKKKIKRNAELVEIEEKQEIAEGVISTGEMKSDIVEQSIICNSGKQNILITGCAHPGLTSIINKASRDRELTAVIGGFHGFENFERLEDIPLIIPCHCTQYKDKIKEKFPKRTKDCFAGLELNFED